MANCSGSYSGSAKSLPLKTSDPAAKSHLKWSSAYAWNGSSLDPTFVNLAMAASLGSAEGFARRGMKSALAAFQGGSSQVFLRSKTAPGSTLVPDWQQKIDALATKMRPAVQAREIVAVFLGDEVCCHVPSCMATTLSPVAARLRSHFNRSELLIWTNECGNTVQGLPATPGAVPAAIDVLSVDMYGGFVQATHGRDEVQAVSAFFKTEVFPRLRPPQRTLVVPGLFGCSNTTAAGSMAQQDARLVDKVKAYAAYLKSESRHLGLAPWHLDTRHNTQCGKPTCLGCDMTVGAEEFPRAMTEWRALGKSIIKAGRSQKSDDRQADIERSVVDVRQFGAVDGESNNAAAIARASKRCTQLGGCTLLFPARSPPTSEPTVYRTSSFMVPSHTRLFIPRGVVLRGTETDADNFDDESWPTHPWVEWPSRPCMSCPYACGGGCGPAKRAWLFVQNATDVEILGGGTLNGGGHWWWCARTDTGHRPAICASTRVQNQTCPPRMIHVLESSDVTIHDVTIEDSPFWTVHIQLSENIEVYNISLRNPHNKTFSSANGDGFDVSSSRNVHIHDSIIDASDDASAVRAGSGWAGMQEEVAPNAFGGRCSTENILFERIEVRNGHGIGRCGEDGRGGVRNATWRDIVLNGNGPQHSAAPPNGVRFEATPTDGGLYESITFERISGARAGFGLSLKENHLTYKSNSSGGPYPSVVPGGPFPTPPPLRPQLRDITVRDVHLEDVQEVGTFFTLQDAPLANVVLSNITLVAKHTEWSCEAWGKGDGKQSRGHVYACDSAAVDVTPPLGRGGCALSCPDNAAQMKSDDATTNLVKNPDFAQRDQNGSIPFWKVGGPFALCTNTTLPGSTASLEWHSSDPHAKHQAATQKIDLVPGKRYVISAYVKTENISGSSGYATVLATWRQSDGSWGGKYPSGFGGTRNWSRVPDTEFLYPAGASDFSIVLTVRPMRPHGATVQPTGWAWFNAISLTPFEPRDSNSNLLINSNFSQRAPDGSPLGWHGVDGKEFSRCTSAAVVGASSSLEWRGSGGKEARVTQVIQGLIPGVRYTYSAYIRTENVTGSDGYVTINLVFREKGGGYGASYPSGPAGTSDWTRVASTFVPQYGDYGHTVILYARPFEPKDPPPTGRAWFDNVTVLHTPPNAFATMLLAPVYRGRITGDGPAAIAIRANFAFDNLTGIPALSLERKLVCLTTGKVLEQNRTAVAPVDLTSTSDISFWTRPQSLPPGKYNVTLRCLNVTSQPEHQLGSTAQYELVRVPDVGATTPKVYIDDQLRTMVRDTSTGKYTPFFPLGLYTYDDTLYMPDNATYERVYSAKAVSDWHNSSFNVVMPYGGVTTAQLDHAWAKGIRVAVSLKSLFARRHNLTSMCLELDFNETFCRGNKSMLEKPVLEARVREFRKHPALLAYYLNDEMGTEWLPQLTKHYQWAMAEDPDHPTWQDLAAGGGSRAAEYLDSTDVIGSDVYPIGMPGHSPSMMRENMELFSTSLGKAGPGPGLSRPVWQVTQVFNWDQMGSEGTAFCKRGGCHTPNRTEVRSMAWQAIAGGAMGVWFYTYDALHRNTDESFEVGWENLKSVASEIAHFSPALLSTRVPDPNVENDPSWLMMRTHRLDNASATTDTLSLFAVSDGTGGGSVTFRVHLLQAAYAVSGDNAPRKLAVAGQGFTDQVPPLEIRAYQLIVRRQNSVSLKTDERTTHMLELLANATAEEFPKLRQKISNQAPTFNPPDTIYSVAADVYPLLEAAARSKNAEYIDSLCSLFVSANASLRLIDAAIVHDIGTFNYSAPVRVWRSPGPDGQEDILSSSQFLYGVSRAASAVASLPAKERTRAMLRLVRFAREHAWSTYRRWVWPVSGEGLFEMKGYGCPAGHARGNGLADKAYGHEQFVRLLLSRSFQGPPVFCNAVSDVTLWIIAATTELLYVHTAGLLPLSSQHLKQLKQYVALGARLAESRLTPTNLTGGLEGLTFDEGMFVGSPTYEYAGCTQSTFPTTACPAKTTSWDISHGRRFVPVFSTLDRLRRLTGSHFDYFPRLCRQFEMAVWNGDTGRPLFSNFMDGSNGWYRVGYAGRSGFGYGPWALSNVAVDGGWGLWADKCPNISSRLGAALWAMMTSTAPATVRFRTRNFVPAGAHWEGGSRVNGSTTAYTLSDNAAMLAFLPPQVLLQIKTDDTAPAISWATSPVRPGETCVIQASRHINATVVLSQGGQTVNVAPTLTGNHSLFFVVPRSFSAEAFRCRLRTGAGVSEAYTVNAPTTWWWQGGLGNQSSQGGWLRVFGQNLHATGLTTRARACLAGSCSVLSADTGSVSSYQAKFELPSSLAAGVYTLELAASASDPVFYPAKSFMYSIGAGAQPNRSTFAVVARASPTWQGHPGGKVFSVLDFGATGFTCRVDKDQCKYDTATAAFKAALKAAGEHPGGGVVYLPRGRYIIDPGAHTGLVVPDKVVVRGEARHLTTIYFSGKMVILSRFA